jgi:methionyl-tRNA synthetase
LRVRETFLLTGTDEHGLKVQEAARRLGLTPQQMCDGIAGEFRNCFDSLTVGYDRFATASYQAAVLLLPHVNRS